MKSKSDDAYTVFYFFIGFMVLSFLLMLVV